MKKTLSAVFVALLTLTACGGTESGTAPEPGPTTESPETNPSPTTEPTNEPQTENTTLEPNPDGYTMQARFYWVPHEVDTQPTRARFMMRAPTDENTYITEGLDYDVLPSIDTGDYYQHTFFLEDGETMSAAGYVRDTPVEGRVACLLIETEQEVVLDYQESEPGEDSAYCYGYAPDVEHDYTPGTPPDDFEIEKE